MAIHNDIGNLGELLAKQFLVAAGYRILETNFRLRKAEIDLIVADDNYLVVVEVKTRSKAFLTPLSQIITPTKINLLTRAANFYVQSRQIDKEVRFDVISITLEGKQHTLEHIKDAFYHF